jgi:hypothetical protein
VRSFDPIRPGRRESTPVALGLDIPEKQDGQPSLESHQDSQEATGTTVALAKGMDEHQFNMGHRNGFSNLLNGTVPARRESLERTSFILGHQAGNCRRSCKLEFAFAHIDPSILPRPPINSTEPDFVDSTDIGGSETVVWRICLDQFLQDSTLLLGLDLIHFPLAPDAKEVLEDTTL